MTAYSYYDKFSGKLNVDGVEDDIFNAFETELQKKCKSYNNRFMADLLPIFKAQSGKWKVLYRLFKTRNGFSPIRKDGFKDTWEKIFPEFKDKL